MGIKYLVGVIVLILVAAGVGYFVGKAGLNQLSTPTISNNATPAAEQSAVSAPKENPIFTTQTATVQGKITGLKGSDITIANEKGQTAQFSASSKIVIYKFAAGATTTTASQDLKTLETNKPMSATLTLNNGTYEVTSITFTPSAPPPPAK
jgi:uncharacterized protein (UPF0333 family)